MIIKEYNEFKNDTNFRSGDRVMIKYKDSAYYKKIGTIISIVVSGKFKGDCNVEIDYSNKNVDFYYTNLYKIEEIVDASTGELYVVSLEDAIDLAIAGIIKFNEKDNYYYFEEDDRWQIESFEL